MCAYVNSESTCDSRRENDWSHGGNSETVVVLMSGDEKGGGRMRTAWLGHWSRYDGYGSRHRRSAVIGRERESIPGAPAGTWPSARLVPDRGAGFPYRCATSRRNWWRRAGYRLPRRG